MNTNLYNRLTTAVKFLSKELTKISFTIAAGTPLPYNVGQGLLKVMVHRDLSFEMNGVR
jgi:hypothetical protein